MVNQLISKHDRGKIEQDFSFNINTEQLLHMKVGENQ